MNMAKFVSIHTVGRQFDDKVCSMFLSAMQHAWSWKLLCVKST